MFRRTNHHEGIVWHSREVEKIHGIADSARGKPSQANCLRICNKTCRYRLFIGTLINTFRKHKLESLLAAFPDLDLIFLAETKETVANTIEDHYQFVCHSCYVSRGTNWFPPGRDPLAD